MLEALKHGKLSREQENMEDILTSNVFGILQYHEESLLEYLRLAENLNGKKIGENLPPVKSVSCDFWPPLHEKGCDSCEPDVLITLDHDDGSKSLVMIEAKYRSGKSSYAESEEKQEKLEEEERKKAKDQIAKEWQNLKAISEGKTAFLVYVTADIGIPYKDIEEAQDELKNKTGEGNFYWLSWRHLPPLIKNSEERILRDLAEILTKRFQFIFFEGIKAPEHVKHIEWLFTHNFYWEFQQIKPFNWRFIS